MKSTTMFGWLLALAVLGAACGGGSSGDSTTATITGGEANEPATSDSGSSEDSDEPSAAASSPIGAYFEQSGGFDAAFAEYAIQVEEEIIVCMAAQGFEYSASAAGIPEADRLLSELTRREWVTQFGYGVSTSFDSLIAQQASDPNTERILTMSEDERELWIETLAGVQNGFTGAPPDLEEQGCVGQAIIATGGAGVIEGLDTFGNAYEEGEKALLDRREMIDAVDAWSRCLSQAGYPDMTNRDDPEALIRDRFEEVVAPLEAAIEDIDPDDARALFAGDAVEIDDLPGLDVEALRVLQDDERRLALADLDCYNEHAAAIYEPLRDAFENGLITEYQSELDAVRSLGS